MPAFYGDPVKLEAWKKKCAETRAKSKLTKGPRLLVSGIEDSISELDATIAMLHRSRAALVKSLEAFKVTEYAGAL